MSIKRNLIANLLLVLVPMILFLSCAALTVTKGRGGRTIIAKANPYKIESRELHPDKLPPDSILKTFIGRTILDSSQFITFALKFSAIEQPTQADTSCWIWKDTASASLIILSKVEKQSGLLRYNYRGYQWLLHNGFSDYVDD